MKEGPLGIYYLDYANVTFPRSRRKMILGCTKSEFLIKLEHMHIPNEYYCWIQECTKPQYLFQGTMADGMVWITKHMPDNFGEPLNGQVRSFERR